MQRKVRVKLLMRRAPEARRILTATLTQPGAYLRAWKRPKRRCESTEFSRIFLAKFGKTVHHRLVEKQCAQCGAAMTCQQEAGCWCAELPHVPMPAGDEGCLCRNCLLAKIEALKNSAKTKEA